MFFLIMLVAFVSLNLYLVRRGWQALAETGLIRPLALFLYIGLFISFFVGHSIARRSPGRMSETFSAAGFFYIGALFYLFFFVFLLDLVRLADHFFPFFPKVLRENGQIAGQIAFLAVVGMTVALMIGGWIHSRHFRVKPLDITIAKKAGAFEALNLVLLSDIHLGPFLHTKRLEKIVEAVNDLNPDLVLIPGDIVNEETLREELEKMVLIFQKVRSRFGIFACTGNHEYFAGIEKSLAYLRRSGIIVLQDEVKLVAGSFYIVGRSNRSYIGQREQRKPLKEILSGVDIRFPVILLDHQPVHLEEAAEAGVDFQLSGHTHAGGVFPFTLINNLLFEIGSGYGRKMNTQYYVTSGIGVWAPPARLGTTAEIVRITVKFLS